MSIIVTARLRALVLAFGMLSLGTCITASASEGAVDAQAQPVDVVATSGSQPTIVFESGLGATHDAWKEILPEIATTHAVFAYSRPGYGRSAPVQRPRDGETIVAELRALLKSRNVKPPYVLVGHSAGGLYMQLFARRYPKEVAGLVLVDPTHPTQFDGEGALENRVSPALLLLARATIGGPFREEFDALVPTGHQVLSAPPLPRTVPVEILVAPDKAGTAMAAFDNAKRQDFANLYPYARMEAVEGGHQIPREKPEAVVAAIRRVLSAPKRR